MSLSLFQRGLILVGAPLILEVALISSLSFLLYQSAEERLQENKYRKFASEVASLIGYVSSAPFELASSIQSREEKHFRRYEAQVAKAKLALDEVGSIVKDIPEVSQSDFDELKKSVDAVFDVTRDIAARRKDVDSFNTIEKMESFQATLVKTKKNCYLHLERMFDVGDEMTALAQSKLNRTQDIQLIIVGTGILANLFVAVLLALFFKRGISQRIGVIARNTEALAEGSALLPEIGGRDEIGRFDRSFHSMLEQLAEAAKNEKDLFENASDVILVLDKNWNFERVSPASQKDWNYKPEELVGRALSTILSEADRLSVLEGLSRIREKKGFESFESKIVTFDSGEKFGLWSAYWSDDENRMYCIVHDATESRLIENERKKFLEMISSDLKIPLQKIADAFRSIGTVFGDGVTPKLKDKLDMTRKNLRRLLALVNDLLLVSQMESGSFELDFQNQNASDLMKSAAADLEALLSNKQIELVLQECEGDVYSDHGRVIQVIVNLLSNAVKFSPKKSTIILAAKSESENLDFMRFEVIDQGRGVPASHFDKIFEKFSQVEIADGKRRAGTGLGLPICKQLIELHGGKIGVHSVEGQGSTFWFTLPRTVGAFERATASSSDGRLASPAGGGGGSGSNVGSNDGSDLVSASNVGSNDGSNLMSASNVGSNDGSDLVSASNVGSNEGSDLMSASNVGANDGSDLVSTSNAGCDGESGNKLSSKNALSPATSSTYSGNTSAMKRFFSELSLGQKGVLLVAVPLLAELVLSGFLLQSLLQTQYYRTRELHRRQIALTASKLSKFILYSSGSVVNSVENFRWDRFSKSIKACRSLEVIMSDLVENDPVERKEFDAFMPIAVRLNEYSLKLLRSNLANSNEGVASLLQEKVRHLKDVVAVCTHLRNIIHEAEKKEFASPERELNQRHLQFMLLYLALLINIAFSIFLAILFSVGVSKRILIMADNARRLANEDRLNPLIGGKDEIAKLDKAFHETANLLEVARRKERAVLDNSRDVLCVLSNTGQFVSVNHAACERWGYEKRDLLSMNVSQVLPASDYVFLKSAFLTDTAGSDTLSALELSVVCKNENLVPVLWSGTRRAGQSNTFCVVHDISDKRALEELRREFLAMVSHDLRTPLTAIVVVAHLIEAGAFGTVPSECSEPVDTVKLNVQALLELISDILDLEKLSAGKMQLNLNKVAWSAVILQLHNQAPSLRCPFLIDASEEIADELVELDEERTVHSLMSFCRYLAFHSPSSGGRTLNLRFERNADYIRILLSDNCSVRAEGLQNLLTHGVAGPEPEQMSEQTFHPEIAIPLARKIIDSHMGTVEFNFNENGANRLEVSLPRKSRESVIS